MQHQSIVGQLVPRHGQSDHQRNQLHAQAATRLRCIGTSGSITNSLAVPFNVGDYLITGPATLSSPPGGQVPANLTFASTNFYSGQVNATCDATALSGAQCTLSPTNPITIESGRCLARDRLHQCSEQRHTRHLQHQHQYARHDWRTQPTWTIALTVIQDFTLGALTPATQTINPGQSASYNFSVLPVGASFTNAVTLSCSGAP